MACESNITSQSELVCVDLKRLSVINVTSSVTRKRDVPVQEFCSSFELVSGHFPLTFLAHHAPMQLQAAQNSLPTHDSRRTVQVQQSSS